MLNQSFFSLKNILHIVGVICILLCSFFGFLYFFKGNEVISGILSAFISFILVILTHNMVRYKMAPTKTGVSIQERVLLFFYLITAIANAPILIHFVNTEFVLKDQIRSNANDKIAVILDMQKSYMRSVEQECSNMNREISALVTAYINGDKSTRSKLNTKYGFNFTLESLKTTVQFQDILKEQQKNAVNTYRQKLTKDLDAFNIENENYTQNARNIINSWDRLRLNSTFYDLDNHIRSNNNFYKERLSSFTYPESNTNSLDLSNPMQMITNKDAMLFFPFLILLLFHVLVLWPYIISSRPDKPKYDKSGEIRGIRY
jgi:hypothetical protein